MNCRSAESRLSAYVDGELGGFEMLSLREHLSTCRSCSREADAIRHAKRLFSALPDHEPDQDFLDRLHSTVLQQSRSKRESIPWGHIALVGSLAAACTAFVFVRLQRAPVRESTSPRTEIASFDVNRDQAFVAGADSFGGRAPIIPATYGSR